MIWFKWFNTNVSFHYNMALKCGEKTAEKTSDTHMTNRLYKLLSAISPLSKCIVYTG